MDEKNPLLNTRASTHGEFSNNSHDTWRLMAIAMQGRNWQEMPDQMKHSLYMILHKVARAVDGNMFHKDHWDDMAGYANLVSNRINDSQDGIQKDHERPITEAGVSVLFSDINTDPGPDTIAQAEFLRNAYIDRALSDAADQPTPATAPDASDPAMALQTDEPNLTVGSKLRTQYEAAGWNFDLEVLKAEMRTWHKDASEGKIFFLLHYAQDMELNLGLAERKLWCKPDNGARRLPDRNECFKDETLEGVVAWRFPTCPNCKQFSSEPCPMVGNSEAMNCRQYRGNTPEIPGVK